MIIGFEWIKNKDFQRNYSHKQPKENPYTPLPQGQLIGFEWNKDADIQQQYSHTSLEPNPYEPVKQGILLGFEWRKDDDTQQQYSRATVKHLFEDDGEVKKYDSNNGWIAVGHTPGTEQLFLEQGMDNLDEVNDKVTSISIPLEEKGDLGEGKLYKAKLNLNGITIQSEAEIINFNHQ